MVRNQHEFFDLTGPNRISMFGAGGHANSTLSLIDAIGGYKFIGFFDDFRPKGASFDHRYEILGNYSDAFALDPEIKFLAIGIGYSLVQRSDLYNSVLMNGRIVPTLKHPKSLVDYNVEIGLGAQIHSGSILRSGTSVGKNVIINSGAVVDHDNLIGDHSSISPSATLCGSVTIGEHAFIGAGAILLPKITVGRSSIVGAGTIVTQDVPDLMMCIGNPGQNVPLTVGSKQLIGGF
jgi:acetyltransferase EpsM